MPSSEIFANLLPENFRHNDIKLFRQNLEELREKQIKLFTFLHFGFLSNDAVKMRL